jgi:hypothetical protein
MSGLPHAGAFVVQFRAGTDFETGHVQGRVEHIASGQAARFQSLDELIGTLARLLKETHPNATPQQR